MPNSSHTVVFLSFLLRAWPGTFSLPSHLVLDGLLAHMLGYTFCLVIFLTSRREDYYRDASTEGRLTREAGQV